MTLNFEDWSEETNHDVTGYSLIVVQIVDAASASAELKSILPNHFASRFSRLLRRLGKSEAAQYLEGKLPTSYNIQTGDAAEILAAEYVKSKTDFDVPIMRLLWKDHRNMSMRGDDAIGVYFPESDDERIEFLKVESKSRKNLVDQAVTGARIALNNDAGHPSPHALSFVADRLADKEEHQKADMIDDAQLNDGITDDQIEHMLFTFSENEPYVRLKKDQDEYDGEFYQNTVGFFVEEQMDFVRSIFVNENEDDD